MCSCTGSCILGSLTWSPRYVCNIHIHINIQIAVSLQASAFTPADEGFAGALVVNNMQAMSPFFLVQKDVTWSFLLFKKMSPCPSCMRHMQAMM